ncbi:MAG: T9SS type A sorting domain-containing protein, partial [Bacteroidales bacterium]
AIGGKWYIYYKGSYSWSHFEAPAAKTTFSNKSSSRKFDIFPNPVNDVLFIKSLERLAIDRIEIYNVTGQQVAKLVRPQFDEQGNIRIQTNFSGSFFIMRIQVGSDTYTQTFIKK